MDSLFFYLGLCAIILFVLILVLRKLYRMVMEDEAKVIKEQRERHARKDKDSIL